jgi:hypothetical protein
LYFLFFCSLEIRREGIRFKTSVKKLLDILTHDVHQFPRRLVDIKDLAFLLFPSKILEETTCHSDPRDLRRFSMSLLTFSTIPLDIEKAVFNSTRVSATIK